MFSKSYPAIVLYAQKYTGILSTAWNYRDSRRCDTSVTWSLVGREEERTRFIAEHNLPFTVMEHLQKLMECVCADSKIAKEIKSSSMKTHAIIDQFMANEKYQLFKQKLR